MRLAGALWLLAGIAYLTSETAAAAAFAGYSYAYDYVSDLGVPYVVVVAGRVLRSPLAAAHDTISVTAGRSLVTRKWYSSLRRFRPPGVM